MGHRDKSKRYSESSGKHPSEGKICSSNKQDVANRCQCSQLVDCFPYKDLPPPAPPDGRSDLWELQFCRWWGWNWVRKREQLATSYKTEELKKPCLATKSRQCLGDECPTKEKKTSFSRDEPVVKSCRRPLTTREQFKAMCKCLLGKKNTPEKMAKLYNTPSTSVMTLKKCDRIAYGVTDKIPDSTCKDKRCKSRKRDKSPEERYPKQSSSKHKSFDACRKKSYQDSSLPISQPSTSDNVTCDPIYSPRQESSTDDSIEYLTLRLQDNAIDWDSPCRPNRYPEQVTQVQRVPAEKEEPVQLVACRYSKQTQTLLKEEADKISGPSAIEIPCAEKLVKLKGKKHKTICIMVCCCNKCSPNNKSDTPEDNDANRTLIDKCEKNDYTYQQSDEKKLEKTKIGKIRSNGTDSPLDKYTTFPFSTQPVNTKKLTKFGTPSKNYPWMKISDSLTTTVSLQNIGTNVSAASNVYDWLDPDVDITTRARSMKLNDLADIAEDLSYLRKINSLGKSQIEDRVLLDALCDTILEDYDEKTSKLLYQFSSENDLNQKHRDLGVHCDFQRDHLTKDAYTKLSRALIKTEEVGVQPSNLHRDLEKSTMNGLDNIIPLVLSNTLSDSISHRKTTSSNGISNMETILNNHSESVEPLLKNFELDKKDPRFTRTGLLPSSTISRLRQPAKRVLSALEKESAGCKKKLKQEYIDSWKNNISAVGKNDNKMENIFSKIEDIVQKSKVKTAEIQKVLDYAPKRKVEHAKFDFSLKNTADPKFTNLSSKRNYPMSSDNFKGYICPNLSERFAFNAHNDFNPTVLVKSCCSLREHTIFAESIEEDVELLSENNKDNEHNSVPIRPNLNVEKIKNIGENLSKSVITLATAANLGSIEKLNEKVSKLSVQNFLVCDEKPEIKSPTSSSATIRFGRKVGRKRLGSKTSLIPIRRQRSTNG